MGAPKTRKKTRPSGLDPKQVFIIQSLTREEIAEKVNSIAETEGWDIPKLQDNDPRLTDEFCKDYCDGLDSGICDADEVVDAQYQYERGCVASEFGIDLDDEDPE
jgi:hypothetical protein